MSKKRTTEKTYLELSKSIRKTWGNINPITRVVRDKTKYTRKIKHKNKEQE